MKKKYLFTYGANFYSEKECLRLETQARKGWRFIKMNKLGFLSFEKSTPEEKQFAIDFYTGSNTPEEIEEYLEMYKASGWDFISSYQSKYFYFQAEKDTAKIFSDKTSYWERLKAEESWNFKRSFRLSGVGLFLIAVVLLFRYFNTWNGFLNGLLGVGITFLFFPFLCLLTIKLMNVRYRNRQDYYKQPEKFAKKQQFWKDALINLLIGGLVGGIIGFIFGYFS